MAFDHSCVVIVPAANVANANKLWCAMGLDTLPGNSFSVELSATGADPVTHRGSHGWQTGDVAASFLALPTGQLPVIAGAWADYGLTEASALAAGLAITVSVMTSGTPQEHFGAALASAGLQRVTRPLVM